LLRHERGAYVISDRVEITITIPQATWEIILRDTGQLQERAHDQGMVDALFDPLVHAAMLLEQAVDMAEEQRKRR
jgi:hypothetical protein